MLRYVKLDRVIPSHHDLHIYANGGKIKTVDTQLCTLHETLSEGTLNTCVFKCHCVQSLCKEIYVRISKLAFVTNAKICEIRLCYSISP